MTVDLSKEALDALVAKLRILDTSYKMPSCSDAAITITALRTENEALRDTHGEQERYLHEAEQWKARATAAEAKLAAAMEGAVIVKQLEWQDFGGHGAKACAMLNSSYIITRWNGRGEYEVSVSTPGHGSAFDGERFHPTIEAAKAAAQADYERRILAAIEPDPEASNARDVAVARAALDEAALLAHRGVTDGGMAKSMALFLDADEWAHYKDACLAYRDKILSLDPAQIVKDMEGKE